MDNVKIAFDYDNTMVDTIKGIIRFITFQNRLKDFNYKLDIKRTGLIFYIVDLITLDMDLNDGCLKTIDYLKNKGVELYLITARRKKSEEVTKYMLDKWGIKFIYTEFPCIDKHKKCEELGIDLLIDDKKEIVNNMVKSNLNVLQFGKHSRYADFAYNWEEVLLYLKCFLAEENKDKIRKRQH